MNAAQPVETLVTDHLDLWTATIKRKSTAGRGSSSKVELYGIKKLHELILELAVRGLLVPQDPNDEPASELLKRIAAEKAKLVKAGKIKKDKPLPPIGEEEIPFNLSSNWGWIRFGDGLDFSGGSQPPKSMFSEIQLDGYVQLLQIRDLGPEPQPVFVPQDSVSKFCTPDDIMIGRYGASVGKVFWGKDGAYNVALIKLDNSLGVYTKQFLYILMKSPIGQGLFSGISRSAQAGFSKSDIENSLLPLLGHAEQHRIVAKVDELMALCDQLEQQTDASLGAHQTLVETLLSALTGATDHAQFTRAWQRIAGHFDTLFTTEESIAQLKQTILQLAVMGKLVPQDPNDEPANVLLGRIATEKARLADHGAIKRDKQPFDISSAQKPFEIPGRWIWSELSQLLALVTDGDHQAPPQSNDGVPFLVIGNLNTGKIKFDGCKYVPIDYYNKLDWVRKPIAGDLLYTVTGSFGIPVLVETGEPFCVQRHVAILKATDSTPRRYLELVLGSVFAIDYASKIATGIAQKTVPLTGLRRMPIPVAPEKEQHRIIAKVDELMALCDQLKYRLNDAKTTQLHLADALVEQAIC